MSDIRQGESGMNNLDANAQLRLLRRTFLKGAGAVGAGLSLGTFGKLSNLSAQAVTGETIQEILDITVTTEMFGVTFLGVGLDSVRQGNLQMIPAEVAIITAARAQEQAHLDFFLSLGGRPLTQTFYVPDPNIVLNRNLFFSTLAAQERREVAAQLAAMLTFTSMNRPDLVKVSFQYAAEEAEHRLLANYSAGARPANDVAFAPILYGSVKEFLADLTRIGIINGPGVAAQYPGPGAIDYTNVIERTPGGPSFSGVRQPAGSTPGAPTPGTPPAPGASPAPGTPAPGASPAPGTPPGSLAPFLPANPVQPPTQGAPGTFLGVPIPPGFG